MAVHSYRTKEKLGGKKFWSIGILADKKFGELCNVPEMLM